MPTVPERLATLEALAIQNRDRLDTVTELIDGGEGMPWERSVRGRLHRIESTLAGFVLRRSYGIGALQGWRSAALILCGVATAAAAWYSVLSR